MNEQTQPHTTPPTPEPTGDDQVSPDALMNSFRGKSLISIVVFTLLAHAAFIGVFSVGYLKDQVFGEDTSSLSESERLDIAVREGTVALREIAERHDVRVQDLSERFNGGSRPSAPVDAETDGAAEPDAETEPAPTDDPGADTPDEPLSDIEQTLRQEEAGPAVPEFSADEEDDLFAPESTP